MERQGADGNSPSAGTNLGGLYQEVAQLSSAAFRLAQEAAANEGDKGDRAQQAQEMNGRLDALLPRIQAVAAADQAAIMQAWTDARLDLGYVLSGGTLPTSTRLFHHLEDRKRGG